MTTEKPYRWKPLIERDGYVVSESPWGPDDEIGRLNWITPESQHSALSRIAPGPTYDLAVDIFMGMPAWLGAGDPKYDIWMTHTPQGTVVDKLNGEGAEVSAVHSYCGDAVTMYTHTGTHMDMLNHFGYHGRFWNGWSPEEHLGSRHWFRGGPENFPNIVARAVMLDIAALHDVEVLPASYTVTARDCRDAAERQRVALEKGDIVMIRTGRMRYWPDPEKYDADSPGIGLEAARYLCEEAGAMVIGSDNDSVEVSPWPEGTYLPVHSYLFATAGAPIIESLWLEDLARDGVSEVAFIGGPLKMHGATGAPMRPLAVPLRPR
ncbi:cyclase family protein [Streptomyces sp. NBC_00144]|uniref:cyclase family protein n=1 Tax=Streptomyces sp. NBC_00144 TaxID=2975665 RepID=UPI0032511A2C